MFSCSPSEVPQMALKTQNPRTTDKSLGFTFVLPKTNFDPFLKNQHKDTKSDMGGRKLKRLSRFGKFCKQKWSAGGAMIRRIFMKITAIKNFARFECPIMRTLRQGHLFFCHNSRDPKKCNLLIAFSTDK